MATSKNGTQNYGWDAAGRLPVKDDVDLIESIGVSSYAKGVTESLQNVERWEAHIYASVARRRALSVAARGRRAPKDGLRRPSGGGKWHTTTVNHGGRCHYGVQPRAELQHRGVWLPFV